MNKLRLKLQELDVQSFETVERADARGTVLGASVESFQPWENCSDACTVPTQPVAICASVPGEVCPIYPPSGTV